METKQSKRSQETVKFNGQSYDLKIEDQLAIKRRFLVATPEAIPNCKLQNVIFPEFNQWILERHAKKFTSQKAPKITVEFRGRNFDGIPTMRCSYYANYDEGLDMIEPQVQFDAQCLWELRVPDQGHFALGHAGDSTLLTPSWFVEAQDNPDFVPLLCRVLGCTEACGKKSQGKPPAEG